MITISYSGGWIYACGCGWEQYYPCTQAHLMERVRFYLNRGELKQVKVL